MKQITNSLSVVALFLLSALVLSEKSAFAYIDAGTGSYIIQMLVAGFFGVIATVVGFWNTIRAKIRSIFGKQETSEDSD